MFLKYVFNGYLVDFEVEFIYLLRVFFSQVNHESIYNSLKGNFLMCGVDLKEKNRKDIPQ